MPTKKKNSPEEPTERKAHKDHFDRVAARQLGAQINAVKPSFDEKKFVRLAVKDIGSLEFAARVTQFSNAMRACLPRKVPDALEILTNSLPEELPNCDSITDGFLQWPVGQFIHDYGLDHFESSMIAMTELTKRFSSEYAVRRFVQDQPQATFERLLKLTSDNSPHVRRWCSEGVRPRLPWGVKINALVDDPSPIWPILEALKDDDELYVRRSVANNMNDIGKDNAQGVLKRCAIWSKNSNERRDYTIKHGLRSLIKQGDIKALKLVGFNAPKNLSVKLKVAPKKIEQGAHVDLTLRCVSQFARTQSLMIDFVVHYVRKGDKSSAKVFKWTTKELRARDELVLTKKLAMKTTTIRALYPGVHKIDVQINGERVATGSFLLEN